MECLGSERKSRIFISESCCNWEHYADFPITVHLHTQHTATECNLTKTLGDIRTTTQSRKAQHCYQCKKNNYMISNTPPHMYTHTHTHTHTVIYI